MNACGGFQDSADFRGLGTGSISEIASIIGEESPYQYSTKLRAPFGEGDDSGVAAVDDHWDPDLRRLLPVGDASLPSDERL